jgi:ABC-2 type transport system ATP-binding protein
MISFSHVTKTYKSRTVVDDFTLDANASIFGFLGENGAGKTTVMKMIVGLLEPTSGTITIDGKPSWDMATRRKIGFMPETPYFYERFTGMEFLRFCDSLFGHMYRHTMSIQGVSTSYVDTTSREAHYETLLARVGIADAKDREISTYSKGMRQRLGFAQALVNDPQYLFLDEPLDGLDPVGRREMKHVMLGLKREGKKIFLNTHILYDVEEICDEMGVIHMGKLLYAGSVQAFAKGKSLEEKFVEIIGAEANFHKESRIQNPESSGAPISTGF